MDLSIVIPAIRTSYWTKLYESIEKSCKKYSWELILISPFDLPKELQDKNNIKMIKDYGHPTRCLQLGIFETEGDMIFHTTDDAICLDGRIDEAMELYKEKCGYKDVVNMRYREGENYSGQEMRESYWWAHGHDALRLNGIPKHYKISLHHLIKTEYLKEMGGYDCQYEHANFSLLDLMLRIQADGGKLIDSIRDVTTCDHSQKDHKAIEDSHNNHDLPLFQNKYSNPNALTDNPIKIDINNWTNAPSYWTRRYKKMPEKYEDLVEK